MHTVVVVALPDTVAFDLTVPVEVFGRVRLQSGEPAYRVVVCGLEPEVGAGPFRIVTDRGLDALDQADTIVVPGRNNVTTPPPHPVAGALHAAFARGTRIVSICSGAFTLAATSCSTVAGPPHTGSVPRHSGRCTRRCCSTRMCSTSTRGRS